MFINLALPFGLGLREFHEDDQLFSEALFFSTRDYFYQLPLPKLQIDLLIKQQFLMQQASYTASFPTAETFVIELNAEPIGKLILNDTNESLHIIDIAFLSEMRNKGWGTVVLCALKKAAEKQSRPLRLLVDQQNSRAKALYLRLGFTLIESSATHDILLWH